jgi:hypothetical protein
MGLPSSLLGYRILPGLQPTKNYLIATVNLQYFLKAFIYMLKLILEQLPTRQKKKSPIWAWSKLLWLGSFDTVHDHKMVQQVIYGFSYCSADCKYTDGFFFWLKVYRWLITFAGTIIKITRLTINGICIRYIWSCSSSSCLPHHINGIRIPPFAWSSWLVRINSCNTQTFVLKLS